MIKKLLFTMLLALVSTSFMATPSFSADLGVIVLDSKFESMQKAGVGRVMFPHARHAKSLKCSDCHEKIFKKEIGANNITMKKNMEGQFCGACHDGLDPRTFALFNCVKCHSGSKEE